MEYKRFNNKIIVKLDVKDEVVSSLLKLSSIENIKLASVTGIGATDNFTVGCFDLTKKEYKKNTFKGSFEIVSLIGNITTMNNEYYLHLHMSCGDPSGNLYGGHLNECFISVTSEIIIDIIDGEVDRIKNDNLGINLLNLK